MEKPKLTMRFFIVILSKVTNVVAMSSFLFLNDFTKFSMNFFFFSSVSASRNKSKSPLAALAPAFLPVEGIPPSTTTHPYSFAIFLVRSLE